MAIPLGAEQLTGFRVCVGVADGDDAWAVGDLAAHLPVGRYRLEACAGLELDPKQRQRLQLAWALGAYRFTAYRQSESSPAQLECDDPEVIRWVEAITWVRDLINTPAGDMMPIQLAEAAERLANRFAGELTQLVGDELLAENYPCIHAVGRASAHPPRLIDLRWGDESHPRVTVVGKGICFDSGGLDIKPPNGMRLMKKDMGGAAHALGLAHLIMATAMPLRLRLLIPAAENAISGSAFRPGDVLNTRAGKSVEVDNTDAEGRLVLADALAEAANEEPELLIDFATLTGAARSALGTEIPVLFSNDEALAEGLLNNRAEPIWRLPLHRPYRKLLESRIADIANAASSPYGGAITAALFLAEFVPATTAWAHLDIMAWNNRARAGRPKGGEAMGLMAVFDYLERRYCASP